MPRSFDPPASMAELWSREVARRAETDALYAECESAIAALTSYFVLGAAWTIPVPARIPRRTVPSAIMLAAEPLVRVHLLPSAWSQKSNEPRHEIERIARAALARECLESGRNVPTSALAAYAGVSAAQVRNLGSERYADGKLKLRISGGLVQHKSAQAWINSRKTAVPEKAHA